ncbi:hypothetical protein [Nannocystis pusilla]|uniref:hypothetical protein n=1 Tax=Nannocystis pusilla TaxID=889268 RepID=UPI003B827EAA
MVTASSIDDTLPVRRCEREVRGGGDGVSNCGGAGSGPSSSSSDSAGSGRSPPRSKRCVSSRRMGAGSSTPVPNVGGGPSSIAEGASIARNIRERPSLPMNSGENSGISPSLIQN